jgi:hypothetical protein
MRLSLRVMGGIVALIVSVMPVSTMAAEQRAYAGIRDTTVNYNGIDGYIRFSGTVMHHPNDNFNASWFGLSDFNGPSGPRWVQIGQTQGTLLNNPTVQRMYGETYSCQGGQHELFDFGVPPTPNYALYVTATNESRGLDPCSAATLYKWNFRIGSWNNPPVAYGSNPARYGHPEAFQENMWAAGGIESINTNYWGLDHSQQVNLSFGMSLYVLSTSAWRSWNATNAPGTAVAFEDPPLDYVRRATWYAFQVHD